MRTTRGEIHGISIRAALAVALALVGATAAFAEPPEVLIGYGGIYMTDGSDLWGTGLRSAGLALQGSMPLTPRLSLEVAATFSERSLALPDSYVVSGGAGRRMERSLGFDIKQRLAATERPGFYGFLSYGLMGIYARDSYPDRTYRYPNGSQYTVPAYTYEDRAGIPFPTVGGGFQKSLGRHAAVRADVQATLFVFLPVGMRASLAMVVPIGSYDR